MEDQAPTDSVSPAAAPNDPAGAQADWAAIELSAPIVRGGTTIASIQLRKPKAGELRGLSLQDVINTDIAALLRLVPRISVPPLLDTEVNDLAPEDLVEIGGAIRGFFMTKAERQILDQLIAEQRPTT